MASSSGQASTTLSFGRLFHHLRNPCFFLFLVCFLFCFPFCFICFPCLLGCFPFCFICFPCFVSLLASPPCSFPCSFLCNIVLPMATLPFLSVTLTLALLSPLLV